MRCGHEMIGRFHAEAGADPLEDLDVSVSIGVASYPEHAAESEGLVKAADEAMYAAKRSEKDTVIVSATSPARVPAVVNRDRRAVSA